MSTTYRVVIAGIKDGFNEEQVTTKLAVLFKTTEEQVKKILSSGGAPVKQGIDLQTASRYQAAIEVTGASVVVEPEVLKTAIAAYCTKCGAEISSEAGFCGKCGAKVGLIDSTTGTQSTYSPPQVIDQVHLKPPKRKIDIYNLSFRDTLKATAILLILSFMGAIFFIKVRESDLSLAGNSMTPNKMFNVFATQPGYVDLFGEAVFDSGAFIKRGLVGVAGSPNGEARAYLAKIRYKLNGEINVIDILLIEHNDQSMRIAFRDETKVQDLLNILESMKFHEG